MKIKEILFSECIYTATQDREIEPKHTLIWIPVIKSSQHKLVCLSVSVLRVEADKL